MTRRRFLTYGAAQAALTAFPAYSQTEESSRPVKIVVGFPPGTGADVLARMLAERFSRVLNRPHIVENQVGHSGSLAAANVAGSAPDGSTLLFCGVAQLAGNPHLLSNIRYDALRSFAPVAMVAENPLFLVSSTKLAAQDLGELLALARRSGSELTYGSSGVGTVTHLAMELFAASTKTRWRHVPYKGGTNVQTALVSGEIDAAFETTAVLPLVHSNRIRALGISTGNRSAVAPDVPAIAESVPGFSASVWYALLLPTGAPPELVTRLNRAVNDALQDTAFSRRLAGYGAEPLGGTATSAAARIASEYTRWGALIKSANIKVEQ